MATVNLPTLTDRVRAALVAYMRGNLSRNKLWSDSVAGAAAVAACDAIDAGATSVNITLRRREDASSFVRTLEGWAERVKGPAQASLWAMAKAVAAADASANPNAVPLRSL